MSDHDHDDKPRCTGKRADGRPCRNPVIRGTTRCYHHSFKVPGRPSKLTPDLVERILDAVLDGAYAEVAAARVGVSVRTLQRWLRRADELEAQALEHVPDDGDVYTHVNPAEWVYLDFRRALKAAQAEAELEDLRMVKLLAAAGGKWQAHGFILERRHPDRWRRRDSVDVTADSGPRRAELIVPSDEDRSAVIARLHAAGALDTGQTPDDESTPE